MFAAILSWFVGGGLSSIEQGLVAAYQAKLTAQNDAQRIAADQTIATLQAQQAVMVGSAGKFSLDAIMRFAFAAPFAIYYAKLILLDKVYCSVAGCSWSTDALSPELTTISGIVISFFFLYSGAVTLLKG